MINIGKFVFTYLLFPLQRYIFFLNAKDFREKKKRRASRLIAPMAYMMFCGFMFFCGLWNNDYLCKKN